MCLHIGDAAVVYRENYHSLLLSLQCVSHVCTPHHDHAAPPQKARRSHQHRHSGSRTRRNVGKRGLPFSDSSWYFTDISVPTAGGLARWASVNPLPTLNVSPEPAGSISQSRAPMTPSCLPFPATC